MSLLSGTLSAPAVRSALYRIAVRTRIWGGLADSFSHWEQGLIYRLSWHADHGLPSVGAACQRSGGEESAGISRPIGKQAAMDLIGSQQRLLRSSKALIDHMPKRCHRFLLGVKEIFKKTCAI